VRSVSGAEKRWLKVFRTLNEFLARLFAADQALDLGRGGISRLAALTGLSRTTITKAVDELEGGRLQVIGRPERLAKCVRIRLAVSWAPRASRTAFAVGPAATITFEFLPRWSTLPEAVGVCGADH